MEPAPPRLQHLLFVITVINVTSYSRSRWMRARTQSTFPCACFPSVLPECKWCHWQSNRSVTPHPHNSRTKEHLAQNSTHSYTLLPLGSQRKMRDQTQAAQQMTRPTMSTTRSATLLLSHRTKKKPRMTSTPHRPYIRLFPSSAKPK